MGDIRSACNEWVVPQHYAVYGNKLFWWYKAFRTLTPVFFYYAIFILAKSVCCLVVRNLHKITYDVLHYYI